VKISIFGLGYVGCVGMGCLSELGHDLIGVDIVPQKVELINNGQATVVEKKLDDLIEAGRKNQKIRATTDTVKAIRDSELSFICVGTPNLPTGHLDMTALESVVEVIGHALAEKKDKFHTIAIRSTVMPGTNRAVAKMLEDISGLREGEGFGVVSNPEFLREGTAVQDFFNPPYTVIASGDSRSREVMRTLYEPLSGELIEVDVEVAELIKFLNNSYHALKVSFANEVGRICKSMKVDSRKLMDLFCRDTILNISPYYFKPGFAYGGSCLPKDLKALQLIAHDHYVDVPILGSVHKSNEEHILAAEQLIVQTGKRKIGLLSISFKPGTDDLRFSPALELTERLLGKGFDVRVYDRNLNLSCLMGKNRDFLFEKLPHIEKILFDSLGELYDWSDALVVGNNEPYLRDFFQSRGNPEGKEIVDLSGALYGSGLPGVTGMCW
jgi:GDP-mannose 6-dehydrogenase